MKRVKRIIARVIVASLMVTAVVTAAPKVQAKVCDAIYGNTSATKTFTVETGKKWTGGSIKLTQSKGKAQFTVWRGTKWKTETISTYGYYHITVKESGKVVSGWNGKAWKDKTIKIPLKKKNAKYTITISPFGPASTPRGIGAYIASKHLEWKTDSSWHIKKEGRNITLCY